MLPVFVSKLKSLFMLKEKSSSKSSRVPLDAKIPPTGIDPFPKSDIVFVMLIEETLSLMSATSLGDISIKSKVHCGIFIVSATTLIPLINSNSLNFTSPELSIKYSGSVVFVIFGVLMSTV